MNQLTSVVDDYLTAYGEPDPDRRASLIARAFAADAELVDPPLTAQGHAGIGDQAQALQSQFPGHRFRRASDVDEHHGHLRFRWELVAPDETVALTGTDVGQVAADGRLARVVGFFGEL